MVPQWIIEKKRDGQPLTADEIRAFIGGYARGTVPDYQMAALAMAIYFQGLNDEELAALADAMLRSGKTLNTSAIPVSKIDKHSTGGIGDKVSLILAPLVACCGVAVPMISGRGLGLTGGTLDKMESIPGYRADLSVARFLEVLGQCGCSIVGQTAELAPADKKLYALRDVTGTVPSIPLIAASIMSKKLAEGLDGLVLDVKCGSGAFMKNPNRARALAQAITDIGQRMKTPVVALITDMNQPLGRTVGNALEVAEAVETLRGQGAPDLLAVTLALATEMLLLAGIADTAETAETLLRKQLDSGAAFENFKAMVRLQGGDPAALDEPARLPAATFEMDVPAPCAGYVERVDPEKIGKACLLLGAGRREVAGTIDPAVGVAGLVKIGEPVEAGQPLMVAHANSEELLEQADPLLTGAVTVASEPVAVPNPILETLRPANNI